MSIEGIVDVALERQELRSGEICLVARVDDDVPGLTVTPEAGQRRQAALLVAHLDAGRLPDPAAGYETVKTCLQTGPNQNAEDPDDE